MPSVRHTTRRLVREEPARTMGVVAGVLVLIADLLVELSHLSVDVPTWSAALPVIVGFALRRFVCVPTQAEPTPDEHDEQAGHGCC